MTNGLPLRAAAFLHSADDAAFDFDSSRRAAAAQLLSGVYQGAGLFVLTGAAGIGKSTLLRNLHRQIAALDGVVLLSPSPPPVCRPAMSLQQLLEACEPRLRLGASAADPLKLARRLQQMAGDGCVPVLLADDADQLDQEALDALATLTGLQTGQRRLLSAVLAGTPELPSRLALPSDDEAPPDGDTDGALGGAPGGGRVITLQPLAHPSVARLLQRRLSAAFDRDAVTAIAHAAGGVPARVIELGERALRLAALRSSATVTREIAAEAGAAYGEPAPDAEHKGPAPGAEHKGPAPGAGSAKVAAEAPHSELPPLAAKRTPLPKGPLAEADTEMEPPSRAAHAGPSVGTVLDPAVGIRTTRLTPARRRGAGIGPKLAIAGGIGFALLLAVGSSLLIGDGPSGGAPDRRLPGGSAPAPSAAGTSTPTGGDVASEADAEAHGAGRGAGDRWWRPPTLEEPSLRAHPIDSPGSAPSQPERLKPEDPLRSQPKPSATATGPSGGPNWDTDADAWASATATRPDARPEASPEIMPGTRPGTEPHAQPDVPAVSSTPVPQRQTAKPVPDQTAKPVPVQPAVIRPEKIQADRTPVKPAANAPATASAAEASKSAALAVPSRKRQIDALLDDGNALLQEGDVEAARASYENAFDRGSGEAARRLAETFDPRTHSPASKQASPEEAILWYQDAARKGDRRAEAELTDLKSWLENSAASGDREARRVLNAWSKPAEPETGPEGDATP